MTRAQPQDSGWEIAAPEPVGALDTWMPRLRAAATGGAIALGVDLPLGVPRAYAALQRDTVDFPGLLRKLQTMPAFFDVCATLDELGPARPFYPARGLAGMTRATHAQALGFADAHFLSRACDRATALRPAGAPLFWTLGANQTGKAAITAWRDWLIPALASATPPRLWPFEGALHALLAPGAVVVAETYPAEAMRHLGLRMGGSKRRQSDRAALAGPLIQAAASLGARFAPPLAAMVQNGFGADPAGEDRFDSLLGVLCVIGVLSGRQPDFIPDDPWIRRWEGWVLGQTALPIRLPDFDQPA